MAAIMEVVVVPKFAPNVSGYDLSSDIALTATKGGSVDVKTELDCTKKVSTAPINIKRYSVRNGQYGRFELEVRRIQTAILPKTVIYVC